MRPFKVRKLTYHKNADFKTATKVYQKAVISCRVGNPLDSHNYLGCCLIHVAMYKTALLVFDGLINPDFGFIQHKCS